MVGGRFYEQTCDETYISTYTSNAKSFEVYVWCNMS